MNLMATNLVNKLKWNRNFVDVLTRARHCITHTTREMINSYVVSFVYDL